MAKNVIAHGDISNKFVIKKDGTKVPFDAEKIKKAITAAAAATDLLRKEKMK